MSSNEPQLPDGRARTVAPPTRLIPSLSVQRLRPAVGQVLLIVVSVLVALGVDEWASDRDAHALEREYLGRLLREVEQNNQIVDRTARMHSSVLYHAQIVYPILADPTATVPDTTAFLVSAYQASRSLFPSFVDDVYRELNSTGNLRLIRSPEVRDALLGYERQLGRQIPFELASLDYRDFIRRLFDPELQFTIREVCRSRSKDPCELGVGIPRRASMVAQLRNNDSVRGSLSLVIEQWSRGSGQVLDPVREDGDSLAAHLRRALQN